MQCQETICIRRKREQLAETAADIFAAEADLSVRERKHFSVALSGGSTPRGMHRLLVKDPWLTRIPWAKTHIFWVDERCVPPESRSSNYGSAKRDFLDDAPLMPDQIHPMLCGTSPPAAAETYQGRLLDFFSPAKWSVLRFDLIFLGLGADGHTASLFPGQPSLAKEERLVVAVKGGKPDVERISMTPRLLNGARHVVFLVSGAKKSEITRAVLTDPGARFPVKRIKPLDGKLTWLLDSAAASLLPERLKHVSIDRWPPSIGLQKRIKPTY
jgi:6-phosphogluconolactonase